MKQKRPTLKEFKTKILRDPKAKALYQDLELEYRLIEELVTQRKSAGLTQEEIAKRMGTQKPNISRLENNLALTKPSPTLATLKKYVDAINCHLEIHVVPNRQ